MSDGAPGRQAANEPAPAPGRPRFGLIGELLLLVWVLGAIGYFYQVRGHLSLARQLIGW